MDGALVGREWEREWLDAALADALDGHGGLVLLTGEAGVGKGGLTSCGRCGPISPCCCRGSR